MTWDADGPSPYRRVAIVRGNGLAGSGGGALPDRWKSAPRYCT